MLSAPAPEIVGIRVKAHGKEWVVVSAVQYDYDGHAWTYIAAEANDAEPLYKRLPVQCFLIRALDSEQT